VVKKFLTKPKLLRLLANRRGFENTLDQLCPTQMAY